jgi:hypothetical protein
LEKEGGSIAVAITTRKIISMILKDDALEKISNDCPRTKFLVFQG